MKAALTHIVFWSLAAIPFFTGIAPAPANVFMGFAITFFIIKRIASRESLIPKTSVLIPLLLYFLIICCSVFYTASLKDTLKGGILRMLQFIFVLLAASLEVKTRKQYWIIFSSVTAGLLLVSLDGIWQVITMKDFIRGYSPVVNIGLVRATASFKDSNTLGIYLSGFAPLVAGVTLYYLRGKSRLSMILLNIAVLAAILLTYSRPTLLAFYVGIWLFALIRRTRLLILALAVLTILFPLILPASVKNWAKEVDYNIVRFMCNDDRIAIYRNTLNMVKHHLVIGVGANSFMKNYRFYKESPEYQNVVTKDSVYAHNNFLHIAGETGLLGLSVFIWLLIALFKAGARIYKRLSEPFLKIYALSLLVCLAAFLINGLTESSLFYSRVAIIFWYLSGVLLSLGQDRAGAKA